jgi:hypothetical protein
MWFGIPEQKMQWVPCPLMGSTISRKRYVDRVQFENGGGDATRSNQYQMEYSFSFNDLAHELDGIDVFNKYASGFYGSNLIHLAHPANFETNMFSAQWATPALISDGWTNICSNIPTFVNTDANDYNLPKHTAHWNITSSPGTYHKKFTLVIPPTHTLYLGATGSATGTAVVRVRPIFPDGTYDTAVDLNLLTPADSSRMNFPFAGSSYSAVDVYITRTDALASTIDITSMMAQLYISTVIPALPSSHYTGEGSTGLMFVDDAIVETYSYMHPPRKGISTTLVEVEAWR